MKTPQEPELSLATIAFEAEQQAYRIQVLVRALAEAHYDTETERLFESLNRLLAPLCEWTSTLADRLRTPSATDASAQEPRP